MGLKEGSLEFLIQGNLFQENSTHVANTLFPQMLQALDCLAHNDILHQDVKPNNILYTLLPAGEYHLQLTDFGLCNFATRAITFAGSPRFMAPEILRSPGSRQTSKVDIGPLFVTMAYALNAGGYRQRPIQTSDEAIKAALAAADTPIMEPIKEMAIVDPEKRASAAQMLVKRFNGIGLSTPREKIPDIQLLGTCGIGAHRIATRALKNLVAPKKLRAQKKSKPLEPSDARKRVQKYASPLAARQGLQRRPGLLQHTLDHFRMPGMFPAEK